MRSRKEEEEEFYKLRKRCYTCNVSLAMMDGLTFSAGTAGVDKGAEWHEQLNSFLIKHNLSVFHKLHVEAIIDRAKLQHVEQFSSNSTSSSITVCRTLQPEYRYAEYLSSVRCFSNRRLLSRFRCGCHGLHVDTCAQGDGWILKGRTGCVMKLKKRKRDTDPMTKVN